MILRRVLLPDPEGPTIATESPDSIDSEISSSTTLFRPELPFSNDRVI
jgi:hypothetical protein